MSDLLLSIHKRLFTGVFHKIKAGRFRDYNILLLIFGFVIISLSSCASTRFQSEETTIQMKGNPTTGYNWFYKISDDSIIAVEENVKYLGDDMIVGAPSMFTYTITALKPGQTTLHFEYKRPWETVEPIETKDYYITVAANGKITITE